MINPQIQVNQVRSVELRQDYEGGQQPIYIGEADPNTGTGSSDWRIRKMIYSGTQLVLQTWATGTGAGIITAVPGQFNQTWKDRTSYTYRSD